MREFHQFNYEKVISLGEIVLLVFQTIEKSKEKNNKKNIKYLHALKFFEHTKPKSPTGQASVVAPISSVRNVNPISHKL